MSSQRGSPDRSDFSRIRHDLRTPVNHILGYAEMLLEDEAFPADWRDDLQRIHTGGRALLTIIKDYFDDEHFAQKRPDPHRMYHELRTPVNHIIGYTELLIDLADDRELPHLRDDFDRIRTAAGNWLALIEAYLLSPSDSTPTDEVAGPAPAATFHTSPDAGTDPITPLQGKLLVVDDDPGNRDMLSRRLRRMGHIVEGASGGAEALARLGSEPFDAVLLDLLMPEMDGYQVLVRMKADPEMAAVRVIILSAFDQEMGVARCIEAGADDYLAKPFNSVFLRARLNACLERKAARDREREYLAEIQAERAKSERLLLNVLPATVAERLKAGESMIADHFDGTTVLFSDLAGFTPLSRRMTPLALVQLLDDVFSRFDELAAGLGLEKIKTIGDAYMVAAGVPVPRPDHAAAAATLALRMRAALERLNTDRGTGLQLRIGLHSGPLAAGIIGRHKFAYDLWGDTVNTASRMESSAEINTIHLSAATAALLGDGFRLAPRGRISVKGIGEMETWTLLTGREPESLSP